MARKKLGTAAKVLGGLGAAYLASGHIRPGVSERDIEEGKVRELLRGLPTAQATAEEMMAKPRLVRGMSAKEIADMASNPFGRAPSDVELAHGTDLVDPQRRFVRGGTGAFLTTADGQGVGVGMKKGGAVKGWGKARGARKAKVY